MSKFKITFYVYCKVLKKEFYNVEFHSSLENAKIRACALNWSISKIEEV